ncbi:glycine betaine ABC transporter substrate-binding protein [Psychrilyobacter atlanticus]|uniref:glycine betaine ABC transporter substrate-binding protein n=1 Tax=Psychrilyobacter atlanticus TaxID=271091 RepID=UPI000408714A|nr:glycine betaine ABC transporter substrate-binding protein [Psychrilyobacter atlanticus]
MESILKNRKQFLEKIEKTNNGDKIILGIIDLSFHRVTGALITYILNKMGYEVERRYAPHEENFKRLKHGGIDMLSSAWIPSSHGGYKADVESLTPVIELGNHYSPYALWGVPDYIPEDMLKTIDDLKKPEVLEKMNKNIQGINIGAGITRFSIKMMEEYGLSDAGYEFKIGNQDLCVEAFEKGVAKKEWLVVPLWQPQFLQHKFKIRDLEEPKGLLGVTDKALLLISEKKAKNTFIKEELEILDKVILSNEIISELDYMYCRGNLSEDEAVKKWFEN